MFADVDHDGEVWLGEGEQQTPGAVQVDDAEAFDGLSGEAIAGGGAARALQGEEGLLERLPDRSPEPGHDLVGVGCTRQAEPAQRSWAENGST